MKEGLPKSKSETGRSEKVKEAVRETKQAALEEELRKAGEKSPVPAAEAPKDLALKEKEARRADRLGIEGSPELKTLIGKGALDTLGSVFGVRAGWEIPRLVRDYFTKKEQRGHISDSTLSLLRETQLSAKARKEREELRKEEKDPSFAFPPTSPVAEKIKSLSQNLKESKLPAKEKLALRKEMAAILKEYRHADKDLGEAGTEKIGTLLDLYINSSAQAMVAARETVNTVSVVAMLPWLRTVGYTAFAGAERAIKAAQDYEKSHFKEKGRRAEKLGFLAKNLTVDAAKETYNGLVGNFFKREVSKTQTAAEFASSLFKLMRVAGLAEFERALQSGTMTTQEGAQKFWSAVEKGELAEALKQGGENWRLNAERLLSYIGLAENPEQAMRKLVGEREAETGATQEERLREILAEKEKIKELAAVRKGEGITHTFVRQLENDPATYGFKGDMNNQVEVHRWAQQRAYSLAVGNGYINVANGEETRVSWDAKNPSAYLLKEDGTVEVLNKKEYLWNPQKEIKAEIERAQAVNKKIDEIYRWKWGPFRGSQIEEWQTVKDLKAAEVLEGKFGPAVGQQLDYAETNNREQMQEYLSELQEKTKLPMKDGETVEEYIRRTNNVRALEVRITEELSAKDPSLDLEEKEVKLSKESLTPQIEGKKVFSGVDGAKIVFEYDTDGNIVKMKPLGDYNFSQRGKLLTDNWRTVLSEMLAKKNIPLGTIGREARLNLNAGGLLQYKKVLEELTRDGLGNSKEAEYLRQHLKDYEAVFKK